MTKPVVYVVARAGDSKYDIAGVFTDSAVANKVRLVHGPMAYVLPVVMDSIPPGYLSALEELQVPL